MRNSFIIYRSFHEAIKELSKEDQVDLWNAICIYSLDFIEPDFTGLKKTIWTLIRPQLEANKRKFENGLQPKKKHEKSKTEAKQKQKKSKTEANVNVNDNVNFNENKNVNVNDIDARKLAFQNDLSKYLDEYGRDMLNSFFMYWTELNQSKTKMRFELEKTWETNLRLIKWKKNNFVAPPQISGKWKDTSNRRNL